MLSRRELLASILAVTAFGSLARAEAATLRPLANGIDISWLPQLEAAGGKFLDFAGKPVDPIRLMKLTGLKVGRVRVFVNPTDNNGSLTRALKLAKRLKNAGLQFALDLHYSDTWADPGHQQIPVDWQSLNATQLATAVEQYTDEVLLRFKNANCSPQWVQLGNEITNGFLWPTGRIWTGTASEWQQFASLRAGAVEALRRRLPLAKSVLHLDCGGDASRLNWWMANADTYGVRGIDVVGLSYYSQWHGNLTDLRSSLNLVANGYRKPVLIAETAYPWTTRTFGRDVIDSSRSRLPNYPLTPTGQSDYTKRLQQLLRALPSNRGLGVWWWEGLTTAVPNSQNAITEMANSALVTPAGKPLPALRALG